MPNNGFEYCVDFKDVCLRLLLRNQINSLSMVLLTSSKWYLVDLVVLMVKSQIIIMLFITGLWGFSITSYLCVTIIMIMYQVSMI